MELFSKYFLDLPQIGHLIYVTYRSAEWFQISIDAVGISPLVLSAFVSRPQPN
jgi:hypothetical protein